MRLAHARAREVLLAGVTALVCAATSGLAQDTTSRGVRIGLTYSPGTKPGLLVLPVNGEQGDSVRSILQRDFDFGDRINVIGSDSTFVVEAPDGSRGQFNYPLYARLGAAAVLQATMTPSGIHVAIHNVAQKKIERVKDFSLTSAPLSPEWRLALHNVADEVEQWITGVRGTSATRILYADARLGRIWQIDSDGANAAPVTGSDQAMSPVWHPRATHIAYTSMGSAGWNIVIRELGGATRVLPAPQGTNSTPAFAPDGSTIVYSHDGGGGTDLYATNAFGSEPARRITVGRGGINTSPAFSPDGRRIAFTSNRSGHAEVYISDADGTNAELLTPYNFGDQSYRSNPDWSPDGRLIVFQSQFEGNFQLMTINLHDRSIKQRTSEGVNEDPSFAPDSRHVAFTSNRTGSRQLFVLDVESGRVRQLTHAAAGARLSAWSPPLRSR
jgi:TolB protein